MTATEQARPYTPEQVEECAMAVHKQAVALGAKVWADWGDVPEANKDQLRITIRTCLDTYLRVTS